jgi:GntR family transcriptional regulator
MELLRERIRAGEWQPGDPIPSERELSERYGISRMTARQAVAELVTERLLYREQGRGTFVIRPTIRQQLLRLTGFSEDMRVRQQRPGARVLAAEMTPADAETAGHLRINVGRPIVRLRRLRLADGEPLALETAHLSFIGCERLWMRISRATRSTASWRSGLTSRRSRRIKRWPRMWPPVMRRSP